MIRIPSGLTAALLPALVFSPDTVLGQQITLGEAVRSALESHPTVAAATARLAASEEASAAARATRLPGVSAGASLTRFQEPMVVAPLHAFDPANPPRFDQTLAQGRLSARYLLFDGGARGSRIRGGDARVQAAGFDVASSRQNVVEDVVASYLNVLASRAVLTAAEAQLTALEEERARVRQNFDAGAAAEVELLRADATLQQSRAELARSEAQTGLAERALTRASGIPFDRIDGVVLDDVRIVPSAVQPTATASPLLARAERAVSASEALLSEREATRLPHVEASAALIDFGTVSSAHTAEWQAGLQVSWPLFTGGARGAAIRRARAEVDAARSDRDALELQVAQQIDVAQTVLTESEARSEALAAAVAQWEEVARIERLALEAGSGLQRDLLSAEAGLFQARAGYARARYDSVLALVQLAKAQGALDLDWIAQNLETR